MNNDNYLNQIALQAWMEAVKGDPKDNEQRTAINELSVEWYKELLEEDKFYEC